MCESRFCQGLEAQCQLCKTTYNISDMTCPNCKDRGALKKRDSRYKQCAVCHCPCAPQDIIAAILPNEKPCPHGICQSCVSEALDIAVDTKSLVSVYQCSHSGCNGRFNLKQFEQVLVAIEDAQSSQKLNFLYEIESRFSFIMSKKDNEVVL